jgi:hypothetical protein
MSLSKGYGKIDTSSMDSKVLTQNRILALVPIRNQIASIWCCAVCSSVSDNWKSWQKVVIKVHHLLLVTVEHSSRRTVLECIKNTHNHSQQTIRL